MTQQQLNQLAGELYGLLHESLGFGELTMSYSRDAPAITYQWSFRARGTNQFSGMSVMADYLEMLDEIRSIEKFASMTSARWKAAHSVL